MLELLGQLESTDHTVVKRPLTQKREVPRKSARLEQLSYKGPLSGRARREYSRYDSNSYVRRDVC